MFNTNKLLPEESQAMKSCAFSQDLNNEILLSYVVKSTDGFQPDVLNLKTGILCLCEIRHFGVSAKSDISECQRNQAFRSVSEIRHFGVSAKSVISECQQNQTFRSVSEIEHFGISAKSE